ncbi:winged helix-turn-helix transcriptional regulator [Halobacterium wangiae]|uniref:winged helix-turn-helix transcriptional regulator n=1 Tax=Halobacterium wangiae TaxID=2902623 RepID=UPI001E32664A|nr:helix-turn-helix domain-containing protein [Halobacterium wangiae]
MADTTDTETDTPDPAVVDQECLCPLGGVMDLLSRRYAMQLICVVGAIGPARYGDIEETFDGVSSSTLSTRLEELVEAGILSREQYAEIPPRVEYDLTEIGEELGEHLEPLLEWAEAIDEEELSVGQT